MIGFTGPLSPTEQLSANQNIPAGQAGSPWTVAPPNIANPVQGSQIVNGTPLNIPQSIPSDNGSSLVAGAIAGANASSQPQQTPTSSTPNLDSASGQTIGQTGDYTQDPNYQTANTNLTDSENTFASGVNNSTGEATMLGNEQGAYGVPGKLQALNDINTKLASATADFNNASQNAETQGVNSGTPSVFYQGTQAAIQRQKAVVVGGLAAQQQAAQGNYDSAQTLAKQTADLQYKDQQDRLDNIAKFVQMNRDNVTAAEKLALSKIDASQKQQQIQLDQQKQAFTLSVTYPQAGITPTDTLASATQKASTYLAQNPQFGSKLVEIGSSYDENGNEIKHYGLQQANGQVIPYNTNYPVTIDSSGNISTGSDAPGNLNLGISTGSQYGVPTYNTSAANPGISRDVRNNNPMSITANASSVNMAGVVGIEKGQNGTPDMLVFSTPQAGVQAGTNMLATSSLYANMKAGQAINLYITGDKNKPGGYSATDLGLDPNKDLQTQLKDPSTLQSVTQKLMQNEDSTAAKNLQNETTSSKPTFDQYGLLGNTDFNPTNTIDKRASQYLDAYIKSGTEPSARTLGLGSKVNMSTITQRANDLYFKATGQPLPNPQIIAQQQALLKNNNQLANNLAIQEQTVSANIDLSLSNMTKNNLNSSKFTPLNDFINKVNLMLSDPATSQMIAQNTTIQNELGSLLAVKNASGTTVYDKLSSAGIISSGDTKEQIQTKIKALLSEASNFKSSIDSANADIYKQIDPLMTNPNNPLRQQYLTAQKSVPQGQVVVISPDNQIGYIPQDQLQEALSNGYIK